MGIISEKEIGMEMDKFINNELLFDLVKAQKYWGFKKVKLFLSRDAKLYHIAAAYGLYCYINDCMDFECTYVLPKEQWGLLLRDMDKPELPENIRENQNDFISVLIDCDKLEDVSTPAYNNTYLILEVCGGRKSKAYGVKGYCSTFCRYSAEILIQCISAYNIVCKYHSQRAIGYLYLSLLDYTSNFESFLTSHLFATMQELSSMECDFEYYNYILHKKSIADLAILTQIYKNAKIENRLAIVTLDKDLGFKDLKTEQFRHCLQFCRFIDSVDLWVFFIERDGDQFDVLLQSNTYTNMDLKSLARRYNGTSRYKQGAFKITKDIKSDVIHSAINTINTQERKVRDQLKKTTPEILEEYKNSLKKLKQGATI